MKDEIASDRDNCFGSLPGAKDVCLVNVSYEVCFPCPFAVNYHDFKKIARFL